MLKDFIRAGPSGTTPAATGQSALGVQQVIEAIMTFSKAGTSVVWQPTAMIP